MDQTELDTSDRYVFDAPSEVVDLAELHNAPPDDTWFEKRESGSLNSSLMVDAVTETPQRNTQEPQDAAPPPPPPSSNIVTTWGDSKPSTSRNQPLRVSKRKMETSGPPTKKQRKSPVAQPLRKSSRITKSKSLRATRSVSSLQTTSSLNTASTEKSSEELELERMKKLQEEVALHRKNNEASYKAALAGDPPAKKTTFAGTVPREFNFKTDARIKPSTSTNATKDVNFVAQLRKPSSPAKGVKGATVPKPFNLSSSRRRKRGEEPAPYVPMAQQIQQYEKRTPDRFHQPSRQTQERGPSPVKSQHKPTVKEPTIPEGFHLQIEKRLQERQAKKPPVVEEEEPPHVFKSHPVPKKILEGVVGVPEKKLPTLTLPESPAFALKKRVRVEPPPVQVKPPSPIKAPPVPHFGLPFQPKLPEHHQVEVCPFSFDKREQERRALKEKRLEQLRNEDVPKFKAQPLPDFSTVVLPEKKKPEPTKPEPFHLLLNERGAQKSSRWETMVQEEKKQQEEATHFKARPNVVTHKEPFKPKKEERADTSLSAAAGFQLLTERRARERQEFDRLVSEKEALRAMMEEQQRREAEEREKEEIARLRQEQVHKAQPVKHYRCVKVKKSDMPLTMPQSPNFSDRFRM
ncbi:targeting protein for Xklp2 isoform X2 [Boleophthalmus pectinirostris]|uniref:targeting protein for Xklp2 isoform X2 n=1 Tax=Boleophthalmus pectinirostris TaxID=150288 RepID=UPI00243260E2|nr:targeting protein for Xklp2 isoform X2 [Boleophthalmus pectinirostris]